MAGMCRRDNYCTVIIYSRRQTLLLSSFLTVPFGYLGCFSPGHMYYMSLVVGTFHLLSYLFLILGMYKQWKVPYAIYAIMSCVMSAWLLTDLWTAIMYDYIFSTNHHVETMFKIAFCGLWFLLTNVYVNSSISAIIVYLQLNGVLVDEDNQ